MRFARRARLALGLASIAGTLVARGLPAQVAPPAVRLVDAGPGFMGRLIEAALASPHIVVPPAESATVLPARATRPRTLIVLGRDARIAGHVRGDAIVVGGDLYLRPGAVVDGRAVAIGGLVVPSSLATTRDGYLSYPDETFDIQVRPDSEYELRYRRLQSPPLRGRLPLTSGITPPTYDRVNGLSIAVSPSIALARARVELQPALTYRSDLGVVDPSVSVSLLFGRARRAELQAGRGTFTNDGWIYGDLLNSVNALVGGRDMRNYFRATRVDLRLFRRAEGAGWELEPWLGGRYERGHSIVLDTGAVNAPWSLLERRSDQGMRRPNPPIDDGELGAALLGSRWRWEPGDLRMTGRLESEFALSAPVSRRFVQTSIDLRIGFPTFGRQRYRLEAYGVLTGGDPAVRQRWVHLGGPGTLRTLGAFEQAGDQLLYLESVYSIPFDRPALPLLGGPTLSIRHIVGASGVGGLPPLEQEGGLRVAMGLIRIDLLHNPARGVSKVSAGFSFTR